MLFAGFSKQTTRSAHVPTPFSGGCRCQPLPPPTHSRPERRGGRTALDTHSRGARRRDEATGRNVRRRNGPRCRGPGRGAGAVRATPARTQKPAQAHHWVSHPRPSSGSARGLCGCTNRPALSTGVVPAAQGARRATRDRSHTRDATHTPRAQRDRHVTGGRAQAELPSATAPERTL